MFLFRFNRINKKKTLTGSISYTIQIKSIFLIFSLKIGYNLLGPQRFRNFSFYLIIISWNYTIFKCLVIEREKAFTVPYGMFLIPLVKKVRLWIEN